MEAPVAVGASSPAEAEPVSFLIPPDRWTVPLSLEDIFGNRRPVEVDVGCGKGRFLVARAQAHPDVNFLGVDRLRGRIGRLDRRIQRAGLGNVRLMLTEASTVISRLLPRESVRTFYLFFPDPWPKRRHHRRRLCGPEFSDAVHRAMQPGAAIHIATDHADYFDQIRRLLDYDPRFERIPEFQPTEEERTDFELVFLRSGAAINRISFRRI